MVKGRIYFEGASAMGNGDGIMFVGDGGGGGGGAVSVPVPAQDARAAPRKPITGRVNVTTDSGLKQAGRLLDLSNGGVSAMFDDPIKAGVICLLDCHVPLHGKAHDLSTISRVVQSILVSGKGYRVGFQFTKVSDGSTDVLRALLT